MENELEHELFNIINDLDNFRQHQSVKERIGDKGVSQIESFILRLNQARRNLEYIREDQYDSIIDIAEEYKKFLNEVINTSTISKDITLEFENNVRFFDDQYHHLLDILTDISTEKRRRTDQRKIEENAESLRKELREVQALKNSLEEQLEKQKDDYEETLTTFQLGKQGKVFEILAAKNSDEATTWLYFIIASGIILICLLFYVKENFCFDSHCFSLETLSSYSRISDDAGKQLLWFEMFKSILFRLLIISANIFLLGFCVKNYNACMHNKTLNELRQNSFDAALHFYRTTTGDKKDEILLKAADAIFSHRTTGYNSKTGDENVSVYKSLIEKLLPGKE